MGILLRYRFAFDADLTYQARVETQKKVLETANPQFAGFLEQETLEMRIRQQLLMVLPEGNYLIRMTTEPIRHSRNRMEQPIAQTPQIVEFVMSPFGQILQTSLPSSQDQPSYPDWELEIGETWIKEGKFATPFSPESLVVPLGYELQSVETVEEEPCAKIRIASEQTFPSQNKQAQKIRIEGTNFFNHRKGNLVKSDIELSLEVAEDGNLIFFGITTRIAKDRHISLLA